MSACELRLRLSVLQSAEGPPQTIAPAITVTEDNSTPVDDDDFVEYYGLQAYVEGILETIYTVSRKTSPLFIIE